MLDDLIAIVVFFWFFICIPALIIGIVIWTIRALIRGDCRPEQSTIVVKVELDYDIPQLFEPLTFEEFAYSLEEFANGLIFGVFHNYPGHFDEMVITEEDIQEMKNNRKFMLCLNSLIRRANYCPRAAYRSSYKIGDERGFSTFYRYFFHKLLQSDATATLSEKLKRKLSFQNHHRWREWRISPPYC